MKKPILIGLSILVIIASIAFIWQRTAGGRRGDSGLMWAPLGKLAAEEVTTLMNGSVTVVAVLFDTRGFGMQGQIRAFEAFREGIKGSGRVSLAGVEQLAPVNLSDGTKGFGLQQLKSLCLKHSSVDLIVCFGGQGFIHFDMLPDQLPAQPRLISVMSFTGDQLADLFGHDRLALSMAPPLPPRSAEDDPPPYTQMVEGIPVQIITPVRAVEWWGTR